VIRVYNDAGNVIETHKHAGEFRMRFQEAGKLQSGRRIALRLLQFREVQHCYPLHASNGRWRYKHVLDSSRSRGND
jgi:hypothetical protein